MVKKNSKINVCIQGMGFVGAAMLANLSTVKDENDKYIYNITGIDVSSKEGKHSCHTDQYKNFHLKPLIKRS